MPIERSAAAVKRTRTILTTPLEPVQLDGGEAMGAVGRGLMARA